MFEKTKNWNKKQKSEILDLIRTETTKLIRFGNFQDPRICPGRGVGISFLVLSSIELEIFVNHPSLRIRVYILMNGNKLANNLRYPWEIMQINRHQQTPMNNPDCAQMQHSPTSNIDLPSSILHPFKFMENSLSISLKISLQKN